MEKTATPEDLLFRLFHFFFFAISRIQNQGFFLSRVLTMKEGDHVLKLTT